MVSFYQGQLVYLPTIGLVDVVMALAILRVLLEDDLTRTFPWIEMITFAAVAILL